MKMGSAVNIGCGHSFKHIDCFQGVMEIDFVTPIRSLSGLFAYKTKMGTGNLSEYSFSAVFVVANASF